MAGYDARINITANTSQADRELSRLQDRLNAVQRAANMEIGDLIRTGGIQRTISTINQLDQAVIALRSTIRTINAPGSGELADQIRTAATASNQFFDSLIAGNRVLSNTISGLRDQSNAFASLAANINSTTDRFTDYIQGAQSAQDKGLRPLFRQFEALRSLYEEGITGRGVQINQAEMGISLFEQLRREVPQTEAALRAFSSELSRIRSLIGSESVAAFGIEQQIIDIEQQLLTIEQNRLETRAAINREMSAPIQSALAGMGNRPNPFGISDEQINEALNNRAEEYQRQQDELLSLNRVLSEMNDKKYDPFGISDEQINQGLNQRAAAYERQIQEISSIQAALSSMEGKKYDPFGISDQQINAALDQRAANYQQQARDISSLQQALGAMESRKTDWATAFGINEADIAADRANRLAKEWENLPVAAAKAKEAADALNSFKFETLAQDADAYTRALLNQQRALDEYTNSANRAANAAKELGYGGEIPALRPAGLTDQDVRIKNLLDDEKEAARIASAYQIEEDKIVSQFAIDNIQRELSAELDRIDAILAAEIAAGEAWWKKAKARLDEKTKIEKEQARQQSLPFLERRFGPRGSRAISEGLIGGAFPLLFGQGIGASIGGLAGGVSGGLAGGGLGFGLSLVGTALGTALDTAIQSAKELAIALEKPVDNFDQLKERALISSKALEKQIQKTIEYGDTATASALIQSDINKRLGGATVKSLQDLAIANDEFARATSASTVQLQVFIAKMIGLAPILRGLASGAKINELQSRAQNTISELKSKGKTVAAGKLEEVFGRTRFTNITPQEYATQLEAAILEAEKKLKPIQIKIDQKQIDESTLNALQKQLEGIDIAKGITDQIRSAAREQQDLDKQRADLVRSYEESIANIRKQVEDEIARRRFSILEKENQLLDLQGQNRIKQLQNANQIIIARAGAGQRPEVEDAAKQAASIVAQFTEEQVSAEEEAAKIKRDAALDARKFDFEAATFKANIEKEVSRLNIETARQVAQINEQVRRRNEETDRKRFEIEKQIAQIGLRKFIGEVSANIENIKKQIEIAKAGGLGEKSPGVIAGRNQIASYQAQINEYNKTISEIEKMRAPAPLRGVGAVGGGSVPTTQISALVSEEKGKIRAITEELTKATRLNAEQSIITFKNKLIDLSKAFNAPITAIATAMDDENQKNIRYAQLLSQGVKGVTAEKIIQIEQERELAKAKYNSAIAELEIQKNAEGVNAGTRAVIESQIVEYQNLRDALDGATAQLAQRAIESSRGEEVRGFINSSIESLNNLETVAIRVSQGIGDAVGGAMNEGINGLIDGTMTAQEVFANFLKNVSQILMQEATKMIATYIAIGIAKAFAGFAGNSGSGAKPDALTGTLQGQAQYLNANGNAFSGNGIVPFAMGGAFTNSIVTAPTLFRFANGGTMGTGVMGEAGPEAVMPLTRGPGGKLGVQAYLADSRAALSGGKSSQDATAFSDNRDALAATSAISRERYVESVITSGASSTEIKYSRVGSGDLPFVTEEDMLQATRIAAQEGAKMGQQRTLAALRNNPATRRSIGV